MKWLIYCHERGAWWRPNHAGYTIDRAQAGRYTLEEASAIVVKANACCDENGVEETMTPEY